MPWHFPAGQKPDLLVQVKQFVCNNLLRERRSQGSGRGAGLQFIIELVQVPH